MVKLLLKNFDFGDSDSKYGDSKICRSRFHLVILACLSSLQHTFSSLMIQKVGRRQAELELESLHILQDNLDLMRESEQTLEQEHFAVDSWIAT